MPCVRSICHGGISRLATRCLIDRAHGRASAYVSKDIGADVSGRWHTWQRLRKIGASSLLKVGFLGAASAARAGVAVTRAIRAATAAGPTWRSRDTADILASL